jgi:recombination DNA repair RAD52 pathway protein
MGFNLKQIKQLLQPINPKRVLRDGKGNAHVAQQDITAHLNRVFGFGNWDKEVLNVELVYEREYQKDGRPRFEVCYKALVRLTIRDPHGELVCTYTDGSMGVSEGMPKRGDAHDLAYKSAISLSTKRAAKDMGDQFGLSLYNKGQMSALVGGTLVGLPEPEDAEETDVQANVAQVVSMGNDEIDHDPTPAELALDDLRALCAKNKWDMKLIADAYDGDLKTANADEINAYINLLKSGAVKV